MVTKDQVQGKKIRKDDSTARNLVTSLMIVMIFKRRNQRRNLRKQTSNEEGEDEANVDVGLVATMASDV